MTLLMPPEERQVESPQPYRALVERWFQPHLDALTATFASALQALRQDGAAEQANLVDSLEQELSVVETRHQQALQVAMDNLQHLHQQQLEEVQCR